MTYVVTLILANIGNVTWWHQAMTRTKCCLSMNSFYGSQTGVMYLEILITSICIMSLKRICIKLLPHHRGSYKLWLVRSSQNPDWSMQRSGKCRWFYSDSQSIYGNWICRKTHQYIRNKHGFQQYIYILHEWITSKWFVSIRLFIRQNDLIEVKLRLKYIDFNKWC